MMEALTEGLFRENGEFYTLNLIPGKSVYGEELKEDDNFEYRHWDPNRSKLAALLKKDFIPKFEPDMDILYLGAGDGTTVSHLSDILTSGKIYAVEFSSKPYRSLLSLAEKRKNIFPINADARRPQEYDDIARQVDLLYQDISQSDQPEIFIKNLRLLKEGGHGMMAIKARSIDVTKEPRDVYRDVKEKVEDPGFDVIDLIDIKPWQRDHAVLIMEK